MDTLKTRGFLIHITHYDPSWIRAKNAEAPFDARVGTEVVGALSAAGFNMLIVDVADGVELASHPEMKRHYSIAMSDFVRFVEASRGAGLEIVPKLNFSKSDHHGHNDWFSPHHVLRDTDEYWTTAFEVIDEVIDACKPGRFFFVGMDEDTTRTDEEYVNAVLRLHGGLAERNLRAVMWNDTPHRSGAMLDCVQKTLAAEAAIPRDVVQCVWDYGPVKARGIRRVREIIEGGFETWLAPGANADHVRAWRSVADETSCEGMVMTMWRPTHASNRDAMLHRIRSLAPLYTGPPSEGPPISTRVKEPAKPVVSVDTGNDAGGIDDPMLAPNHLAESLAANAYVLPSDAYVCNWMLLGPLPFEPGAYEGDEQQDAADDATFVPVPEHELVARPEGTKEYGATWRRYSPPEAERFPQIIDLARFYGATDYSVVYAVAHIHSDSDVTGYGLYVGSDDYAKVWLNGALVHTYNERTRAVSVDADGLTGIALHRGWNKLVFKCVNVVAGWGFMVRFADADDLPVVTTSGAV